MTDQITSFRQSCLSWCANHAVQMGSNSSMKSNISLEKKIRLCTRENFDSVLDETEKVRSTKFVEEMARAFIANPLKDHFDIISLAKLANIFSRLYPDFPTSLCLFIRNQLNEVFRTAPSQWRKLLLFYFELFLFDVHSDLLNMGKYANLIACENTNNSIEMLDFFVEISHLYFGLFSSMEPKTKFESIISTFKLIYQSYCSKLISTNKNLLKFLDKERKYYENRGDLHEDRVQTINSLLKTVTDMELRLKSISTCINEPVPEVKMYQDVELTASSITFVELHFESTLSLYDNDEERKFYEVLPAISSPIEDNLEQSENDLMMQDAAIPELDPDAFKSSEQKFFDELCCAQSMEDIDSLAMDVIKNVYDMPQAFILSEIFRSLKNRPESVKLLSRFTSILCFHLPDFGKKLVLNILGQISFLSKRLELILNARARLANFVGELCKFKALSDGAVFTCLRKTLDNPHLANILMVCTIIEVCGKFLLNRKGSHKRMLNLIEVVSRLKNTMPYPLYAISIIDATINSLQNRDPEHPQHAATPAFPSVSFIKPLLRSPNFDPESDLVYEIFRSLNWEHELETLKIRATFLKAWKVPFSSIRPFALFLCKVLTSHPSFVHSLLNDYCEIILTEIETTRPNTQKLISTFHLLCIICQVHSIAQGLMHRLMETVLLTFEFPNSNVFQRNAIASCVHFCMRHFDDFLGGPDSNDPLRKRLNNLISDYYKELPISKTKKTISPIKSERTMQFANISEHDYRDSSFDDDVARVIHKAVEERKLERKQILTDVSTDLQRLKLVDTNVATDDTTRFIFKRRNKIQSKQLVSKFSAKEDVSS